MDESDEFMCVVCEIQLKPGELVYRIPECEHLQHASCPPCERCPFDGEYLDLNASHEEKRFSFDPTTIALRRNRLRMTRGRPSSCRNLAWFCEQDQDYTGARKLYIKATKKNPPSGTAFMDLAKLYENGLGVASNASEAKKLKEQGQKILDELAIRNKSFLLKMQSQQPEKQITLNEDISLQARVKSCNDGNKVDVDADKEKLKEETAIEQDRIRPLEQKNSLKSPNQDNQADTNHGDSNLSPEPAETSTSPSIIEEEPQHDCVVDSKSTNEVQIDAPDLPPHLKSSARKKSDGCGDMVQCEESTVRNHGNHNHSGTNLQIRASDTTSVPPPVTQMKSPVGKHDSEDSAKQIKPNQDERIETQAIKKKDGQNNQAVYVTGDETGLDAVETEGATVTSPKSEQSLMSVSLPNGLEASTPESVKIIQRFESYRKEEENFPELQEKNKFPKENNICETHPIDTVNVEMNVNKHDSQGDEMNELGTLPDETENGPQVDSRRTAAIQDEFNRAENEQPEYLKAKGNELYRAGDFAAAMEAYSQAIAIDNTNAMLLSNRAAAKMQMDDFRSAVDDCKEAIKLHPNYVRAHERLASSYRALGMIAAETEALEVSLQHNPGNVELEQMLRDASSRKTASETAERTSTVEEPLLPEDFNARGSAHFRAAMYADALAAYSRAIELDDSNPAYYSNRAAVNMQLGEFHSAVDDCNHALKLDPQYARAHERLASAYHRLGKYESELEALEVALRQNPENAELARMRRDAQARLMMNKGSFVRNGGHVRKEPERAKRISDLTTETSYTSTSTNTSARQEGTGGGVDWTATDATASMPNLQNTSTQWSHASTRTKKELFLGSVGEFSDMFGKVEGLSAMIVTRADSALRLMQLKNKVNELQRRRSKYHIKQAANAGVGTVAAVFTLGISSLGTAAGAVHQRNRLRQLVTAMRQCIEQINALRRTFGPDEPQWKESESNVIIDAKVFTKALKREELFGDL